MNPAKRPKAMNPGTLAVICWALWAILFVGGVVMTFMLATESTSSPEMGRSVNLIIIVVLWFLLAGSAFALYRLAHKQSMAGLVILATLFAWPLVSAGKNAAMKWWIVQRDAREMARIGDFRDPVAAPMGAAILTDDPATLRELLRGGTPPTSVDRAGLDLIALACVAVAERRTSADPLEVLLQTGADPNQTRLPESLPLLNFLILRHDVSPHVPAAIELLLRHGLDPNGIDPRSGDTPLRLAAPEPELVRLLLRHGAASDPLDNLGRTPLLEFIGNRYWDSALALVEHGARLDVVDRDGISIDYYLREWRHDVYGEHHTGWDRLRAAIAKRREAEAASP